MNIQALRAELTRLETLASEIRSEGGIIQNPDFWFDTAQNSSGKTYYRKRWTENDRLRSLTIPLQTRNELKADIARGNRLTKVEKAIARVHVQLTKMSATAAALGLELPA